ncbi:MAG: class I tRNA ligase family protein, partial [Pseudomonadota bacterium]|nr:class I tRNA ligase family protein [Pseudomonadota bacterium]
MPKDKREILVTSALPYANGELHLGHMLEQIQTDIWVRYQKLIGNECTYVCADDAHGTPIMLRAEELGIDPESLISDVYDNHLRDSKGFLIDHDNYHSTHSDENKYFSELIFERCKEKGYILEKEIDQLFDIEKQIFLSDRYVKGICPSCRAKDQYGDNCEVCGKTYLATDLIDPISTLSDTIP